MDKAPPGYEGHDYSPLQTTENPIMPSAPPISAQVQTSIFTTAGLTPTVNYGPKSQNAVCPSCRHMIHTRVKTKATSKTHLWACLLCSCLCCCIPYCMNSCLNINHYCPNCDGFLGTYYS